MQRFILPLLISIIAFLSYYNNFFLVTSDQLFLKHQLNSEQLVLDGILHSLHHEPLQLGYYIRPTVSNTEQSLLSHSLYQAKNAQGDFQEYKSQFGLQLRLFNFLATQIYWNVDFLQAVSALLMSLIVALFFIILRREFSLLQASLFCGLLIFSPWVVIFARNLYWLEATWFLPTVISFFLGKQALVSIKYRLLIAVLLFISFLIKSLCGYEYLSTVALSACVPLCYYTLRYGFARKALVKLLLTCALSLILAFSIAVVIHANTLANHYDEIIVIAKKRLSTENPAALAKEACKASVEIHCEQFFIQSYSDSLTSNRFLVAASYFDMPHTIPWLDRLVLNSTNNELIAIKGLIILSFPLFNLWVFYLALKRRDALSLTVLIALAAPLSWFLLAKGHSYIHYTLNYVLWYLPYIPFSLLLLADKKSYRDKIDRVQT